MIRKLFTALVIVSALYLLPAIGNPAVFGHAQLWILLAVAVVVSVFQPVYKPIDQSAPQHDKRTAAQIVWSVYVTQFIGIIEAAYFQYPESFNWDVITTIGLIGILAGLGLRVWAVLTLGRFFTWFITVYDDHQVIRSGPFRFIRHPAYFGALILFVSTLVFLHAWVGVVLSFGFQLFAYLRRIKYEEALMIEKLGDRYVAYTREVNTMVPGIW